MSQVITADEVLRAACAHYSLTTAELRGRSRAHTVERQAAIYLASELTDRSLGQIGKHFGDRHHTTVLYAITAAEGLIANDNKVASDVEAIRRALRGDA